MFGFIDKLCIRPDSKNLVTLYFDYKFLNKSVCSKKFVLVKLPANQTVRLHIPYNLIGNTKA